MTKTLSREAQKALLSFMDMSEVDCSVCHKEYFHKDNMEAHRDEGSNLYVGPVCWNSPHICNRDPLEAERLIRLHNPPPAA